MPVETPSLFSRVIQEHLELKRRNAALDSDMPLARYMVDDPFSNHPLFKSEEQARLEETMESVGDVTMLLHAAGNEDTAEHEALPGTPQHAAAPAPAVAAAAATTLAAPPALETAAPAAAFATGAPAAPADPDAAGQGATEEVAWGRSRDFDWGD